MSMMIHRHMKKVAEDKKSATTSVKPNKETMTEKPPTKKAGRPKKEQ